MTTDAESDKMMYCASCGIPENDDVKLKKCTACYLVRYCSVKCQKDHRSKHKRDCKKRAAELRDEILFKQPEISHRGDCPICCLPLPIDATKSTMMSCCSKTICNGCDYANKMRELEGKIQPKCPFCRHPLPKSEEEGNRNLMKRVEVNDPAAIRHMGGKRYGEGDYDGAFEYWTKAAGLGNAHSHYQLSVMYREGKDIEKDEKKEVYHLEKAAIGGDIFARSNLAAFEWNNGRHDRALQHWIIAAKLGDENSVDTLKDAYRKGYVRKEDFASALRAHQAAVNATKSPQREEAAAALGGFQSK
eukprot:scaffold7175_cov70-Skeletonema_dohrnii-CCMP3373.AAC.2